MFFPNDPWWTEQCPGGPPGPGIVYLCERWWELLKDWHGISYFDAPCSYPTSLLEDFVDAIDDLQSGRVRTEHQLDAICDELIQVLRQDFALRHSFPSEISTTQDSITELFKGVAPPGDKERYSQIKKKSSEARRASMAARRLHHRCLKRWTAAPDMTWSGYGGLVESDLLREALSPTPSYSKIDRLLTAFLLDCVYRGYDLAYLTTLFDRYLTGQGSYENALLHVFRRVHSRRRHCYTAFFCLRGASKLAMKSADPRMQVHEPSEVRAVARDEDAAAFLAQYSPGDGVIISVERVGDPDSGSAEGRARKQVQEIVDFLDFGNPNQLFQLGQTGLVVQADVEAEGEPEEGPTPKKVSRLFPDAATAQRPRPDFEAEIDADWVDQIRGLSEALRWASVARRETTPEVKLLACWFAFEFLAGDTLRTPVEGIMEYYPKVLAVGNLRRRLGYWWRSLASCVDLKSLPGGKDVERRGQHHGGSPNYMGILSLLVEAQDPAKPMGQIMSNLRTRSTLLAERTLSEGKAFMNNQLLGEQIALDARRIRWDLQRLLTMRNKLVHRASLEHPMLRLIATRAERLLGDLLRDISGQFSAHALRESVAGILDDYRDTYDEVLRDLGSNATTPDNFVDRLLLA